MTIMNHPKVPLKKIWHSLRKLGAYNRFEMGFQKYFFDTAALAGVLITHDPSVCIPCLSLPALNPAQNVGQRLMQDCQILVNNTGELYCVSTLAY